MPRAARACATLALALPLHATTIAMAQPRDAAAGRALFQEGRTLFEQGRTDEACAKFEQSESVDPAPGTELGLAACWEKQGRTASAWGMFGRAEASSVAANRTEWAEHARRKRAELEPGLAKIRLRIAGGAPPEGLELRWNGAGIASDQLDEPIPVDPGAHRLEASRPAHRSWTTTIDVPAGPSVLELDVPSLEPLPSAPRPAAPTAPPADSSSGARTPLLVGGFAALGVGAIGIALGSYYGVSAFSNDGDARDDCPTPTTCGRVGLAADERARDAATASTISFAVGLAAVVGGIVLLIVAPEAPAKPRALALEVAW